jgi:glycosyltransferase involved in cell wall biosynthesis
MLLSTYRRSGGHETVIDNIAKGLMKLGHEVVIGAFSFEKTPPDSIQTLHLSRFRNIVHSINNVDIIHCHQTKLNYYSLINSKPFIFQYHGIGGRIQQVNLKFSIVLCKSKISKIIGVSNFALSEVMRFGGASALKIPAEVIYAGVDTYFYHANLPRPYKSGDPQLLFVGNLFKYKKVTRILEELPNMLRSFPNLHFQIVGTGEDTQNIRMEIGRKKLEKHVELIGNVTDLEDLRLRYSSADIYVSASTKETVGLPLLESMACGKPVIVSNIPAHRELVNASNAGLEFSLTDNHGIENGLSEILDNKTEYSNAAIGFAMKNDWSKVCARLSQIYQEIVVTHK